MKNLVLALLLLVLTSLSFSTAKIEALPLMDTPQDAALDQCPDQDVWVYVKHPAHEIGEKYCRVIVHIPKRTLEGDFYNCPAQDTKAVGKGVIGFKFFAGYHVVTIEKGLLNNTKNYTTRPPRAIEVPANNRNTWHVKK